MILGNSESGVGDTAPSRGEAAALTSALEFVSPR